MSVDCIYKKYEPLFGSWYITEKIGEGAIAQVYAMERRELGVTYHAALKAITIPSSEDEVKSAMADGMTSAEEAAATVTDSWGGTQYLFLRGSAWTRLQEYYATLNG